MSIGFPQDNPILPTGRLSQSWQRFLQALKSRIGDVVSYTPTVSARTGALVSAGASSTYQKIGDWIFWTVVVNVFDNGTGSGSIALTLPVKTFAAVIGCGRNTNTGNMVQCTDFVPRPAGAPASGISVYNYDGTYPVGLSGTLHLQIAYEVQ